jgi:hypothetical protein
MQTVVDSKKRLLSVSEIISRSAIEVTPDVNPTILLGTITAEMTLPTADVVQIGNTVFLGHRSKEGKNTGKMFGRAFNLDTARNFVTNGFKYFTYLQKNGITHYTTEFSNPMYLNAFKILKRRLEQLDTKVYIARYESEENGVGYLAFGKIGKQPLTRGL